MPDGEMADGIPDRGAGRGADGIPEPLSHDGTGGSAGAAGRWNSLVSGGAASRRRRLAPKSSQRPISSTTATSTNNRTFLGMSTPCEAVSYTHLTLPTSDLV